MKILVIHNFYMNRGGEGKAAEQMISLFREKGHKVVSYFQDNREIEDFSIRQKFLLPFKSIFSLKSYKKILTLVKEEKPDVAHIHNVQPLISPSVFYALKKMNIPVIQTLHNYRLICPMAQFINNKMEICEKCKNGNFIYAILFKCYQNSYVKSLVLSMGISFHRWIGTFKKKVDIYISPSNFLKSKMVEGGFSDNKIRVINNFVDTRKLIPDDDYNYNDYGIYLGRVSKEKGVLTLIKAFQRVPGLKLKIVGDGPLKKNLENYADINKIDNIEFLGFIGGKERFEILRKAMFMIVPSEWYENLPYVVLESFAVGTPIIASRIGGLIELIEEGKNGLFFSIGNVEDLGKKILSLAENSKLITQMRYYARKTVEKKYNQEVGYRKIIDLYKELCSRKNHSNI